jgi:MFS family permease
MGGMLLIALSNNLTTLTIAMTVLAIGNGLTNPTFQGCMSLLSRADEQGVVMGVGHSLSALGRILGPLIGGFVFQNVSIVAPYLASSVLAGVSLVLYFQIRNQIPNQGQRV